MSVVVHAGVLGTLASFDLAGRRLERVAVTSDDLAKRLLRFATSAGDVGIRFDGAERLRDGDVIHADERIVVAVALEPDDVLLLRPPSFASAIALAHALGNRHLPIQLEADAIVVRYDPLLETLAAEHGVPLARERRVLERPFAHPHAPHRHD